MVVSRKDARRRRLVIDPAAPTGDAREETADATSNPPRRKKSKPSDVRAYTFGADRRSQRKTTDLIPKRLLSFLLVVLVLLSCIGLLNFTYTQSPSWTSHLGQEAIQAFQIRGQGSLASWFSSFLLIITGLASLQIYALRQHRCNDYRGTYRLWIWMAALFLIASMGCVVNLEAITSSLAQTIVPGSLSSRTWMPHAIKLIALALLVIRGIYEVRESRGSLALVVFVWIAYSTATIMQFPETRQTWVQLDTNQIAGNCILFGTVGLLVAHLTYARFVFMQAHGLIKIRVKKTKTKKAKTPVAQTTRKKKQKPIAAKSRSESVKSKPKTPAVATKATRKSKAAPQPKAAPRPKAAPQPKAAPVIVKAKPTPANDQPATQPSNSAKQTLQEMAAASRAKTNAKKQSAETPDTDSVPNGIIKMSKAQRRKQRKVDKQRRRAA